LAELNWKPKGQILEDEEYMGQIPGSIAGWRMTEYSLQRQLKKNQS
jgi:hypothetical protein